VSLGPGAIPPGLRSTRLGSSAPSRFSTPDQWERFPGRRRRRLPASQWSSSAKMVDMSTTVASSREFAARAIADGELRLAVRYWTGGIRLQINDVLTG